MNLAFPGDSLNQRRQGGGVQRIAVGAGHQQRRRADPGSEPAEIVVRQRMMRLLPPLGIEAKVVVDFLRRVGRGARCQFRRAVHQGRRAYCVSNLRTQGRRNQGQVGADGCHPRRVHFRPPGQVLQPPTAVGHDAAIGVGRRVMDAVGEQAGEAGGIGLVGPPLPAHADGKGDIVPALGIGRALRRQFHHAAVAGQEAAGRKWAVAFGNAQIPENAIGANGGQANSVGGGKVGGAQGDFPQLRSRGQAV